MPPQRWQGELPCQAGALAPGLQRPAQLPWEPRLHAACKCWLCMQQQEITLQVRGTHVPRRTPYTGLAYQS